MPSCAGTLTVKNLNIAFQSVLKRKCYETVLQQVISPWKKDHLFWGKSMSPYHEKTSNITFLQEFFDGFDWNKRDKRMDGFPLMSSIWPTIFISLAYVNLAKIVGPFIMRNKNPLKLDKFARCYNTTQFLCELLLIPWLSVYFFSTGISWSK